MPVWWEFNLTGSQSHCFLVIQALRQYRTEGFFVRRIVDSPLLSTRDYKSFSTLLKKISKSSYMTEHFFMHNNNHPQKKTPKIEAAALLSLPTVHEQLFLDKGKRV